MTKTTYTELVDSLADKQRRNNAVVALVGAINARDLARVTLNPEAKTALIGGLERPNPKVRWWCLQIDHLADAPFIPAVLPLLNDSVGKVRRHAVHALTCDLCKPDRCGLELSEGVRANIAAVARSDPDERVRREAQAALAD